MNNQEPWWKTCMIYQIYLRSFMDSNGDGVGDLPGVIHKLDYLQGLGVKAIWLSPFYPSSGFDSGYDICDYCAIEPIFGTLDDFKDLMAEAHRRDMRVILDLVPNHTSDRHPWFEESRSSRHNSMRDWYIWRDPAGDGGPPNNWQSMFGGSAWTYDRVTRQYYLHTFLETQPDLNWRNPEVREAIYAVMRFWLGLGVDGFRVDVIYALAKDPEFTNDPLNPKPGKNEFERYLHINSLQHPDLHQFLREMRRVVEGFPGERVLIGETYHLATWQESILHYGIGCDECQMPFNFELIRKPLHPVVIREQVNAYDAALPPGAWPNWVLGNHDQHRVATRAGGPALARLLNMMLLTLRGTPTCYYGDELAITDVPIKPEEERDPFGKRVPGEGRDPERTPMPWDGSENAGFSTGTPWLPVAKNYKQVNVEAESCDPASMLTLFRSLAVLRQSTPALMLGDYIPFDAGYQDVFAYLRQYDGDSILVALNFSGEAREFNLSAGDHHGQVLLSTVPDRCGEGLAGSVKLGPLEGLILRPAP